MLHSHVLLQHVEYAHLLHNARYVVLDEARNGTKGALEPAPRSSTIGIGANAH